MFLLPTNKFADSLDIIPHRVLYVNDFFPFFANFFGIFFIVQALDFYGRKGHNILIDFPISNP